MSDLYARPSPDTRAQWRILLAWLTPVLAWLIPVAFLVWLWFDGLHTWFFADDFAWLSLLHRTHSFHDLLSALFAPEAQGTIRPLSERGFFLLFESLFGLDSLPFRICVFLTIAADVALIIWIARRIAGSLLAGAAAATLWIANNAFGTVATWNSAYNEALCPLFLLAATALFIRYGETGRRLYWWLQAVVFILGFGALEVNVVYPALAGAYVLFVQPVEKRRKLLFSLVPLFSISIVYYLLHSTLAPLPKNGPYAVLLDSRVFGTLMTYFRWSLVPADAGSRGEVVIFWVLAIALVSFLIRQSIGNRQYVCFFGAWFLITLAPMLPLPLHITGYYLTIPLIGLAMLAGAALAESYRRSWIWRIVAIALAAAYFQGMIPADRDAARWWLDRSLAIRGLVLGVQAAQQTHPDKVIVLDGLSAELYDFALVHSALTAVGLRETYLTPSALTTIHASDPDQLSRLVLDSGTLRRGVADGTAVVYYDVGDHLRNITGTWATLRNNQVSNEDSALPRHVEVGNPLFAYLLGPEWFGVEAPGVRWMPRKATLRMRGPESARQKLVLAGWHSESQLKVGPLHLMVSADGAPVGSAEISGPDAHFRCLLGLPPWLIGRDVVEIELSVDRTSQEPGGRALGLLFGSISFE